MSAGTDKSSQASQGQQTSSVWDQMAPFLTDLYSRGQGLVEQFQPDTQIYNQSVQAQQQLLNPQAQGNPYLDQMAGNFQNQLGILNQQSGGQAALTGGFGGGRQGVAEALNTQNVSQQMGNFYGQQYQADQNRAMQGQLGALGMGQSILGMSPQQQQMQNLQGYGGLIGRPVLESQGTQTSSGKSKGLTGGII